MYVCSCSPIVRLGHCPFFFSCASFWLGATLTVFDLRRTDIVAMVLVTAKGAERLLHMMEKQLTTYEVAAREAFRGLMKAKLGIDPGESTCDIVKCVSECCRARGNINTYGSVLVNRCKNCKIHLFIAYYVALFTNIFFKQILKVTENCKYSTDGKALLEFSLSVHMLIIQSHNIKYNFKAYI